MILFTWHSGKCKISVLESKLVTAKRWGLRLTTKLQKWPFWCHGNVPYLDCWRGHKTVHMCQTLLLNGRTTFCINYTSRKLNLKTWFEKKFLNEKKVAKCDSKICHVNYFVPPWKCFLLRYINCIRKVIWSISHGKIGSESTISDPRSYQFLQL